jgi:hypothetical protein
MLKFTGTNIKNFSKYRDLHEELKRNKKENLIITAYVNSNKELMIRCDKIKEELVIKNWQADAFGGGLQFVKPKIRYFLAIRHVSADLDFEDDELKNELEVKYGIIGIRRLFKKSTQKPLEIVRLELKNEEAMNNALNTKIKIYSTLFKPSSWKFKVTPRICYNCCQLNHNQKNCENKPICIRCKDSHPKTPFWECHKAERCFHCDGNHSACSKKCEVIQRHMSQMTRQPKPVSKPEQSCIIKSAQQSQLARSAPANSQETLAQSKAFTMKCVTAVTTLLVDILAQLSSVSTAVYDKPQDVASLFASHLIHCIPNIATEVNKVLEMHENDDNDSLSSMEVNEIAAARN